MTYSRILKELFPYVTLDPEDLLLLEKFQIEYLPGRLDQKEFATILRQYPVVHRYFVKSCPAIEDFLEEILQKDVLSDDQQVVDEQCHGVLWEIADLIIYNKHPEQYDKNNRIKWDIDEIISLVPLEGKTVADLGAGSGGIAFMIAPYAKTVYAVEPLSSFRSYMKEKAEYQERDNLYVLDGKLDSIPMPADSLDVLITSNAIGWNLNKELTEIERVVKPGGHAIHLLSSDPDNEITFHEELTSDLWKYHFEKTVDDNRMKAKYYKKLNL